MSKRFISTLLFDDDWFMELSKDGKILWVYLITKCDHAGIIKLNEKLCRTQTGLNDVKRSLKELDTRLYRLTEFNLFIPGYLFFQYTGFPNSKVLQQRGAISILEKLGLIKDGVLTVSTPRNGEERRSTPIGNDIGNEDGNDKGGVGEIELIINHLNNTLGTKYKPNAEETVKLIKARLKDGYKLGDFIKVIETKFSEWGQDPKMSNYLRPETLFSKKFESYLNQKPIQAGLKEAYHQPEEKDYTEKL